MQAEPQLARQRVMVRNGLTEAQAQSRLDAQMKNEDRARHAHRLLDNNTDDPEVLHAAVARVWSEFVLAHPDLGL